MDTLGSHNHLTCADTQGTVSQALPAHSARLEPGAKHRRDSHLAGSRRITLHQDRSIDELADQSPAV